MLQESLLCLGILYQKLKDHQSSFWLRSGRRYWFRGCGQEVVVQGRRGGGRGVEGGGGGDVDEVGGKLWQALHPTTNTRPTPVWGQGRWWLWGVVVGVVLDECCGWCRSGCCGGVVKVNCTHTHSRTYSLTPTYTYTHTYKHIHKPTHLHPHKNLHLHTQLHTHKHT